MFLDDAMRPTPNREFSSCIVVVQLGSCLAKNNKDFPQTPDHPASRIPHPANPMLGPRIPPSERL